MTTSTPHALPWLALVGPTASGKTAAALALVRTQRARGGPDIEVISVDSALVYRGMDIGTAKPDAAELAEVRHHLIDRIEPTGAYSAAEFAQDAQRLVAEIHARGHRALLVGGTMLYLKAWLEGIDPLPAADPAVRAAIDARARVLGWPALHAELARIDPVTAARLAPADAQRIQRALEVHALTGQPLSALHRKDRHDATAGAPSPSPSPAGPGTLIALEPQSRAWLHGRIADRFQQMLAAGLVDEVRRLRARGDLTADLPSMRCVGYRQTWEMLDGVFPPAELAERGIAATRQLAKRQLTWLRGMSTRRVVACDAADAQAQVLSLAEQAAFLVPAP